MTCDSCQCAFIIIKSTQRGTPALISVIFGEKGSGKTKRILDLANKASAEARGSIVFIDDDNSYMFDLNSSIRFVNAADYEITSPKTLYGFLCGLSASDFDLECIFIDGFLNFAQIKLEALEEFFSYLAKFSDRHSIRIVLSISGSADKIPTYLQPYVQHTT